MVFDDIAHSPLQDRVINLWRGRRKTTGGPQPSTRRTAIQALDEAERELLAEHYDLVCKVARKIAPDWWEDAAQIATFGAVKGIRSWRPDGGTPLAKWIAYNAAHQVRRAISRGKAPIPGIELDFDVEDDHQAEEEVDRRDEIAAMRDAVDDLPDPYRQVILFYLATNNKKTAARRMRWGQLRYNQALLVAQEYLRWRYRGGSTSAAA